MRRGEPLRIPLQAARRGRFPVAYHVARHDRFHPHVAAAGGRLLGPHAQRRRRRSSRPPPFADCLFVCIAQTHGCEATMTLDARAAKAAGITLVT